MCPWSNAYSTRSGTSFDMCSRTRSASGVDLAKLDRYLIENVNATACVVQSTGQYLLLWSERRVRAPAAS